MELFCEVFHVNVEEPATLADRKAVHTTSFMAPGLVWAACLAGCVQPSKASQSCLNWRRSLLLVDEQLLSERNHTRLLLATDENKKIAGTHAAFHGQRTGGGHRRPSDPSPPVWQISTRPQRQQSKRFVWVGAAGGVIYRRRPTQRTRTGPAARALQCSRLGRHSSRLSTIAHTTNDLKWLNGRPKPNQCRLTDGSWSPLKNVTDSSLRVRNAQHVIQPAEQRDDRITTHSLQRN